MVTDLCSTFAEDTDCMKIVGSDMSKAGRRARPTRRPASRADEVDVCELHDCFSANELITYEALGFAAEGEGAQAGRGRGDHLRRRRPGRQPLGRPDLQGPPARRDRASRSAPSSPGSCAATADKRQVEGAKIALQHNIGLGGAAVVTVYKPAA